jgi:hypothetical protein
VVRGTGAVDKVSSVQLKKMVLVPQGLGWRVSGGDIAYAFLGQKGSGKLQDFDTR